MNRLFLKIIIIILATFEVSMCDDVVTNNDKYDISVKKFGYILNKIINEHPDSINTIEYSEKIFDMMLKKLDPYSSYISKDDFQKLMNRSKGISYGLPFNLVFVNDTMRILNEDGNKKYRVDYRIIQINEISAKKENRREINNLLTNDELKVVNVKIIDKNNDIKSFQIEKQIKDVSSIVYTEKLNDELLYVKLDMFSASTLIEFKNKIKNYQFESLLIDLRENTGGYVYSASDIASVFIDEGLLITSLVSKSGDYDSTYISKDVGITIDCAVVLLVSEHTGSAAEIFAGCIQDYDRGYIVGEITEGKGLIQKLWSFADSTALSLVVGSYFTPLGRSIQKPYNDELLNELKDDLLIQGFDDDNEFSEMINRSGGRTKLPTYITGKGRVLLGGGGIIPDEIIQNDTIPMYTKALISRQIFIEFAYLFYDNMDNYLAQFKDVKDFQLRFVIGNEVLISFSRYLQQRNILNKELFNKEIEAIKTYIKTFIAYIKWGSYGFQYIKTSNDVDIKKALDKIMNAKELIKK